LAAALTGLLASVFQLLQDIFHHSTFLLFMPDYTRGTA